MPDYKPAFQAELETGDFTRLITGIEETVQQVSDGKGGTRDRITHKLTTRPEKYTERYMIYYPQGHSIGVPADDIEQLQRLGVLQPPPLIDMETGDAVPEGFELTPKQIVEAKTRNRSRPHTGGLTDVMEN